jgi:hypothetical protein
MPVAKKGDASTSNTLFYCQVYFSGVTLRKYIQILERMYCKHRENVGLIEGGKTRRKRAVVNANELMFIKHASDLS